MPVIKLSRARIIYPVPSYGIHQTNYSEKRNKRIAVSWRFVYIFLQTIGTGVSKFDALDFSHLNYGDAEPRILFCKYYLPQIHTNDSSGKVVI